MIRTGAALIVLMLAGACEKQSDTATDPSPSPSPSTFAFTDSERALCVSQTNELRASVGRPPLARSSSLEEFATRAAEADHNSRQAHSYYSANAAGVWSAENEVLFWPITLYGTVQGVVRAAISGYWSEGPGGGHYNNIVGAYMQLGCGAHIEGTSITFVQEFR